VTFPYISMTLRGTNHVTLPHNAYNT